MAGGTNVAQLAPFLRADLDKAMKLWSTKKRPSEGDMLVGGNKITSTESFIKMAQATVPNIPRPVAERQSFPESRYDKKDTATYTNQKYALLLTFSSEVWDDNQYRSIVLGGYASDLMSRCHHVRDLALVNEFFNLMDTNLAPDGVAYVSASHTLDPEAAEFTASGTAIASNEITGDPTVSTDALNTAGDILQRQVDSKGQLMEVVPPFVIECDSKRVVLWRSIAAPVNGYEPFTTDRNPGKFYSAMISNVIGLARSTHRDRWTCRATSSEEHSRFVWDRQTPKLSPMEYVIGEGIMKVDIQFRLSKGLFDWRGFVSSLAGT